VRGMRDLPDVPGYADDAERDEAPHHEPNDVLATHQPTVEEGQIGRHDHAGRGAQKDERRVAGVDVRDLDPVKRTARA
jgi:hypothetical protein